MEQKEMVKAARLFFSLAGAVLGVFGLLITIIGYVVLAPAVDGFGQSVVGELDSVYIALGSAEGTLGSTSEAIDAFPQAAQNTADALDAYGNSSLEVGSALSSLGTTLDGFSGYLPMPKETIDKLKNGAGLSASAVSMKKAAGDVRTMGTKAQQASDNVKMMKDNIGTIKTGVLDAREKVSALFKALQNVLVLFAVVTALVFLVLISYSIAAAL